MPVAPRSIWLGSAAAVAIATAAALLVVLTGGPDETDARTLGTLVDALLCGGAALAALELVEHGMVVPGTSVLIGSAAAFAVTALGLWKFGYEPVGEGESPDGWFRLVPIGFAWSIALVLGATTMLLARDGRRRAAIAVCIVSAAWAIAVTAVASVEADIDDWTKLIGALAVLAVGSFLFAPLSQRAQRPA